MAELERAEISARIRQARLEAGLKQHEMAELLGVIPRTLQNYEADRVPWDKLGHIAEITGKTATWLLHGDAVQVEDDRLNLIEGKLDRLLEMLSPIDADAQFEQELQAASEQDQQQADDTEEDAPGQAGLGQ